MRRVSADDPRKIRCIGENLWFLLLAEMMINPGATEKITTKKQHRDRRGLSKTQAVKLAEFFNLRVEVFL
jgi:hypothetical protein